MNLPVIHMPNPRLPNQFLGVVKGHSIRCYGQIRKEGSWEFPYDITCARGFLVPYLVENQISRLWRIVEIEDQTVWIECEGRRIDLSLYEFNRVITSNL